MSVKVFFEDIQEQIIKLLKESKESVKICVAWINRDIYKPVLDELSKKGIQIEVMYNLDYVNSNHGLPLSNDYDVYQISTRISSSLMHNKFCIIDDEIIINGSYNWSSKAKNSFENILVIRGEFETVKSFLHEFYDLKNYCIQFSKNNLEKCKCQSHLYNLAVLGDETGIYQDSVVDVWSICAKNRHVTYVGEEYVQYLQTHLGLKDVPKWDDYEDEYGKESMLREFKIERNQIESLQTFFNERNGIQIHAVGSVGIYNEMEFHQGYGDAIYCLGMLWRDMYYRKVIPEIIFEYDDGEAIEIIDKHNPSNYLNINV